MTIKNIVLTPLQRDQLLKQFSIQIGEHLGSGGNGSIYAAFDHTRRQESLAIKLVQTRKVGRWETKCLGFRHPNVVATHRYGKLDSGISFFLMDRHWGGSLSQYIHDLPDDVICSEDRVRVWMQQLTSALRYLHEEMSLAHRDIKCGNLVLSEGRVKLIDFGFLVPTRDPTTGLIVKCRRGLMGVAYSIFPPNMLERRPYDPRKTDVWEVGCCLVQLFMKRLPFKGTDLASILQSQADGVVEREFQADDRFSPELKDLVARLLTRDEDQRPDIIAVAAHPWLHGTQLGGLTTTAVQGPR